MPKQAKRRQNLQWVRVLPGTATMPINTLVSSALITPASLNLNTDDATLVKAYIDVRITATGAAVAGIHNCRGAVGIVKRDMPADTSQFDPINEDAAWMWWRPFMLSSAPGTPPNTEHFMHYFIELNASRQMQRFQGITAFSKVDSTSAVGANISIGGSFLFWKP